MVRERRDVAIHHAHHCRGDPPERERMHQRQRPHLIEKRGDVRNYQWHRGDANGEERDRGRKEMDRCAADPEQVGMIQMLVMTSGPRCFGSRRRRRARGFGSLCCFKSAGHDAKTVSSYPVILQPAAELKSAARAKRPTEEIRDACRLQILCVTSGIDASLSWLAWAGRVTRKMPHSRARIIVDGAVAGIIGAIV